MALYEPANRLTLLRLATKTLKQRIISGMVGLEAKMQTNGDLPRSLIYPRENTVEAVSSSYLFFTLSSTSINLLLINSRYNSFGVQHTGI
jgi:hypothetical protein